MSRKGKQPIALPKNVEVKISQDHIAVKGPKGALESPLKKGIQVKQQEQELVVAVENAEDKNFHGLFRSLIANMVKGVTTGFSKTLDMVGVGYRASVQGKLLDLQLGYSHPTQLKIPDGLTVQVENNNTAIVINGLDAQKVGQFAAEVRAMRPPEPYQGKGIRYRNEYIRRKAGKSAAKK